MAMKNEIARASAILSEGGTILYPTDTIWGIGCDATLPSAVEKAYRIKKRKEPKAMLVLVDSISMLEQYIEEVPGMAMEILSVTNEPLTIIYPGASGLAANLVHEDGSAGIRITSDPFCAGLLKSFRKPIVSTSANISGHKPPGNFTQVEQVILDAVDYTVDWRREDRVKRKPSGILKVGLDGEIAVIRK